MKRPSVSVSNSSNNRAVKTQQVEKKRESESDGGEWDREREREREWERERNKKGFTRIVLSSLECERGLACYNENKIINTVFVYKVLKFQCGSEIVEIL